MKNFNFDLNKRHKIIIASILATLCFLYITHTVNVVFRRYYLIVIMAAVVYVLSLWSLWKGMTKLKVFILLVLPIFYCIGVPSFYFLFREIRWLTRLPAALFFGLSYYCLLLSQNVLHVASDRTIPLYRAASAANFVFTVFTGIPLAAVLFSFNLPFYLNGLFVFMIFLPLVLQNLWSVRVEDISMQMIIYAAIASLLLAQSAVALSFWSISPFVRSLYLSTILYVILGVLLDFMQDKIKRRLVLEYIGVGSGVFLFILVFTYILN